MKIQKIIIVLLTVCFLTTSDLYSFEKLKTGKNIVKIENKYFRVKDGKLFPLLGIILKFIGPKIISSVKQKALTYAKNFFIEKSIEILDESFTNRDDVEEITINAQDSDNDGKIEFATEHEQHLNEEISNDDNLHFEEYDNIETGVENEINNQLESIDKFYDGDIDGDGKSD